MSNNPALDQIAKALQAQDATTIDVRTGTALSGTNRTTGVITVALDNDPGGTPVSAICVAGLVPTGARVFMLAYPPRGLAVIGQIGGVPGLQFAESHDFTNQASYTLAAATLGTPAVGFVFTAPASGSVLLDVSVFMDVAGMNTVTTIGARGRVFGQVREGATIGAGTLTWDGDGDNGPLVVFENQKAGGATPGTVARVGMASGDAPVVGLIPNKVYNASMWYRLETAAAGFSMGVNSRRITALLVA